MQQNEYDALMMDLLLTPGLEAEGPGVLTQARSPADSIVYEPFYGLNEKAFSLSANPRFLYKNESHPLVAGGLADAICRREGLIVVTGDVGTGKTMLCRALASALPQRTSIAFLPHPFVSRQDLLKMLLVEFGVAHPEEFRRADLNDSSHLHLSYRVREFLESLQLLDSLAVLIIDEAQSLTPSLLEEIKVLSDLENGEKLLQILLVGQLDLTTRLRQPQMRPLAQRVSAHYELRPLRRGDLAPYVTHRLSVAGGGHVEFPPAALDGIYSATAGVPRLVNLVCDRALYRAHTLRSTTIHVEIVNMALGDLGFCASSAPADAPAESLPAAPEAEATRDAAPAEPLTMQDRPRFKVDLDLPTIDELSSVSVAPALTANRSRVVYPRRTSATTTNWAEELRAQRLKARIA
jgi:general secretion pathway protein A